MAGPGRRQPPAPAPFQPVPLRAYPRRIGPFHGLDLTGRRRGGGPPCCAAGRWPTVRLKERAPSRPAIRIAGRTAAAPTCAERGPFAPGSLSGSPLCGFLRPFRDGEGEPPPIRVFVDGLTFAISTAHVPLIAADSFVLAGRFNGRPGPTVTSGWRAERSPCTVPGARRRTAAPGPRPGVGCMSAFGRGPPSQVYSCGQLPPVR